MFAFENNYQQTRSISTFFFIILIFKILIPRLFFIFFYYFKICKIIYSTFKNIYIKEQNTTLRGRIDSPPFSDLHEQRVKEYLQENDKFKSKNLLY